MKVLWDRVVSKVVRKLEETGIAKGLHIWWCPTEFLALLPFHAAGPYEDAHGKERYLIDDYISSFTPTLQSLINARSGLDNGNQRLLFVGDTTLAATKREFDAIRACKCISKCLLGDRASRDTVIGALSRAGWVQFACHGTLNQEPFKSSFAFDAIRACKCISKCLLGDRASRDTVTGALSRAGWVHFACHGTLNQEPFKSSFVLSGGELTLLDIASAHLPKAEFACLSACHTAEQSPNSALDEVLHPAAAMQFCGSCLIVMDLSSPEGSTRT
ncbi:TPR-like protein [Sanghuangporus baumii]|uniref:TPR-like protein n=1 Tax=Sanghuangporus baumii TaxID=108892 RepID=A0A9Q5I1Y6_SANBA|nr:TPR-like protein [Sanghuangporus baumii]